MMHLRHITTTSARLSSMLPSHAFSDPTSHADATNWCNSSDNTASIFSCSGLLQSWEDRDVEMNRYSVIFIRGFLLRWNGRVDGELALLSCTQPEPL